jgi:hypothetical protein
VRPVCHENGLSVVDSDPDKIFAVRGLSSSATLEELYTGIHSVGVGVWLWDRITATPISSDQMYMFEYIRDHRPLYERCAYISIQRFFVLFDRH